MNVLRKLNAARKQFHERQIKKTGYNDFAKYEYFELADFLVPALQICESLNLSAVVSFGVELATMTLTDLDDGSQFVITSPMSTAKLKACHEVQNLGAVQTYLRRYLWVAALEIVEHDSLNMTHAEVTSNGFDVLEALDLVEASITLDVLEKVWKDQSAKARKAQNRGGYDALLNAVNDKKKALSK